MRSPSLALLWCLLPTLAPAATATEVRAAVVKAVPCYHAHAATHGG